MSSARCSKFKKLKVLNNNVEIQLSYTACNLKRCYFSINEQIGTRDISFLHDNRKILKNTKGVVVETNFCGSIIKYKKLLRLTTIGSNSKFPTRNKSC